MATLRRVELPPEVAGPLLLSSMPGRFEPWAEALEALRVAEVGLVLCLTPLEELERLAPAYRRAVDDPALLPFRWRHLPMENFGLPADRAAFAAGIDEAAAMLRAGRGVMLHCAAGIGRTGCAAACVAKHLGLPTQDALERVRRAGSNPETAVQSGLVHRF